MQKCKRVVYCRSRANRGHIITYTKIKALGHVKEQIFWDSWKGCVFTSSSLLPRSTIFQRTMQTHCGGLQRFNGVKTCIILGPCYYFHCFYLRCFDFTLKSGTFGVPGWSCWEAGQHGTNPGHPGKSGRDGWQPQPLVSARYEMLF